MVRGLLAQLDGALNKIPEANTSISILCVVMHECELVDAITAVQESVDALHAWQAAGVRSSEDQAKEDARREESLTHSLINQ